MVWGLLYKKMDRKGNKLQIKTFVILFDIIWNLW